MQNTSVDQREHARHYISASDADIDAMLKTVGKASLSELFDHIPEDVVEQVAAWFVRHADDDDLPFAVVMSLRTLMTLHTDARGSEAMMRIMQRVQWIEGLVQLPPEAPTPGMMTDLAKTLQGRYLPRRMTG